MGLLDKILKPKKTREEVILDLGIELSRLEENYNVIIMRELRAVKKSRAQGRTNARAVDKIKNAYYGLLIIGRAKENLRDIRTTHDLTKTMNEMGAALRVLNGISGQSEHVRRWLINYNVEAMDRNAERRGDGLKQVFPESINELVGDDIVERLLSGESVDSCLNGGDELLFSEEGGLNFTEELINQINSLSGGDGTGLDEQMDVVNAAMSALGEDE